ncbi:MAG: hypothetical protein KC897_06065 [Candidatus Omnitrophica bacterium]|nr:hypothetical protein [Candidatus Omnitrophota bacterium]MCB9719754.1 hypothetical protein [Candidatus Omnitrophota bacterium]
MTKDLWRRLNFLAAAVFMLFWWTTSPVMAQPVMRKAVGGPRVLKKIPNLEVQLQNKEFINWGKEIVIYTPRELIFRWGPPGSVTSARWELYQDQVEIGNRLDSVAIPAATDPTAQQWFKINLNGYIPTAPGGNTYIYYVRVVPNGGNLANSSVVKIIYRGDTSDTKFSDFGLYPELQLPMRVKVQLQNFHIIRADEEDDEEPYIIPLVAWMDGTTIDAANIPTSTVRVDRAFQHEVHGNLPVSNSQGSGSSISIPVNVGHFEEDIQLIGLNLINHCDPGDMKNCLITMQKLMNATTVWVMVIALEEDESPDDVINTVRHQIVDEFQKQFTECVTGLSFAELLDMLRNGFDGDVVTDTTPGRQFCGFTSTEDETILDQLVAKFKAFAVGEVIEGTLIDITSFIQGINQVYSLNQGFDSDDVIGFGFQVFTFDDIARADGPIPVTIRIRKADNSGVATAGIHQVEYEIQGIITRCNKVPGKSICENVDEPLFP